MKTEKRALRIDRPCPFAPTHWNKVEGGHYCRSCQKTVVDFRGMTPEEILARISSNTCGIFDISQLPGQAPMKTSRRWLLSFLTLLSFLGFSAQPLSAQTNQSLKDSVKVASTNTKDGSNDSKEDKLKKKNPEKKRKGWFRRRRSRRMTGCPNF